MDFVCVLSDVFVCVWIDVCECLKCLCGCVMVLM